MRARAPLSPSASPLACRIHWRRAPLSPLSTIWGHESTQNLRQDVLFIALHAVIPSIRRLPAPPSPHGTEAGRAETEVAGGQGMSSMLQATARENTHLGASQPFLQIFGFQGSVSSCFLAITSAAADVILTQDTNHERRQRE